jgi:hypothetical protein
MAAGKLIDLRRLLAEKFPEERLPAASSLPTDLPRFDQTLDGGLSKGAITELASPFSNAGSASLIAALLEGARRKGGFIALIDGRDSFDPQSVGSGALRHLLWVRCHKASEAMRAADWLLRDGNFPLVVLDLVLNPLGELGKIPSSSWYRLQRLVEPAATAFLVLTPRSMISSAQWKLVLENRWSLAQLDCPAAELHSQMNFRLERAHPNKWRREEALARAG